MYRSVLRVAAAVLVAGAVALTLSPAATAAPLADGDRDGRQAAPVAAWSQLVELVTGLWDAVVGASGSVPAAAGVPVSTASPELAGESCDRGPGMDPNG